MIEVLNHRGPPHIMNKQTATT
ncbi:transcriptional regulator, partial [Salmonella enterica]|nr:transcriptional regulator [Salmonella enterica]